MTFLSIDQSLVDRFKTQITLGGDGGAAVVTRFPQDPGDEPSSGIWARVTNRAGERQQVDFGSSVKTIREQGRFMCELYSDADDGVKDVLALAQRVATAFDLLENSDVVCGPVSRNNPGDVRTAGKWARLVVSVPWYADTVG